jgi:hypothetical protein
MMFRVVEWNFAPMHTLLPWRSRLEFLRSTTMIKSFVIATALVTTAFMGTAGAQARKMVCDEAQLVALERGAVALTDLAKREAATKSVASMRQMLTSKDLAACEVRMNAHVKDYGDVQ